MRAQANLSEVETVVGTQGSLKNCISHIDASHSRQPLVKGERLVRYEVNAVMTSMFATQASAIRDEKTMCATMLVSVSQASLWKKWLAIGWVALFEQALKHDCKLLCKPLRFRHGA